MEFAVQAVPRILLALGTTVLMLAAAEGAVRAGWFDQQLHGEQARAQSSMVRAECIEPSPIRGWAARPDVCGRGPHGVFDGGNPNPRPEGVPRVLVVGDSVSADDGWTRVMESELRAAVHPELQVWNAAVASYDTCQEAHALSELIDEADPDVVLVQTCVNDVGGSLMISPVGNGRVRIRRGLKSAEFPAWMLHSRLLSWGAALWTASQGEEEALASLKTLEACMRDMQQTASEHGAAFGVLHFPVLVSNTRNIPSEFLRDERSLVQLSQTVGLHHLDLRLLLGEEAILESLSSPGDTIHLSRDGSNRAGAIIGSTLGHSPMFEPFRTMPSRN